MLHTHTQFSCSNCGRVIDIGEPFLATATFPARSFIQEDVITADFLQNQGEVLCRICAVSRLGAGNLARLNGAVFVNEASPQKKFTTK